MGEKPERMSLDRIDNEKGYSKDNCRWATRLQQANNSRSNRILTVRTTTNPTGITDTLANLCRHFGVKYSTVNQRLQLGWPIELAIFTPKLR